MSTIGELNRIEEEIKKQAEILDKTISNWASQLEKSLQCPNTFEKRCWLRQVAKRVYIHPIDYENRMRRMD